MTSQLKVGYGFFKWIVFFWAVSNLQKKLNENYPPSPHSQCPLFFTSHRGTLGARLGFADLRNDLGCWGDGQEVHRLTNGGFSACIFIWGRESTPTLSWLSGLEGRRAAKGHQEWHCHSRLRPECGLAFKSCSFLSHQAPPCSAWSVCIVFCPLELDCTAYIAGEDLVVDLRTVNASPCKTNYWGRNSSSSFFTSSSLSFWRLLGGWTLSGCPLRLCIQAPGSAGGPRAESAEGPPGAGRSAGCTPDAAAVCLLSFCHYSSSCSCLYFTPVSQFLIMAFF